MKWFGEAWPSPSYRAGVCENDADQIETPVGRECLYCHVAIVDGDRGVMIPHVTDQGRTSVEQPHHIGCLMKNTVGQWAADALEILIAARREHHGD